MALHGKYKVIEFKWESWKLKYGDLNLDPKGWIVVGSGSV